MWIKAEVSIHMFDKLELKGSISICGSTINVYSSLYVFALEICVIEMSVI